MFGERFWKKTRSWLVPDWPPSKFSSNRLQTMRKYLELIKYRTLEEYVKEENILEISFVFYFFNVVRGTAVGYPKRIANLRSRRG